MEIEMVEIKTLKPHPRNPRIHPESALRTLETSIKEYGWTNPILVSKDSVILAGHARLKAALRLGITEAPVLRLDIAGAEAEAYMIMDNRSADLSMWSYPDLKDLLEGAGELNRRVIITFADAGEESAFWAHFGRTEVPERRVLFRWSEIHND